MVPEMPAVLLQNSEAEFVQFLIVICDPERTLTISGKSF